MNNLTKLLITLADIDSPQKIDETREWRGIMDGKSYVDQSIFVGFYIGDSPPVDGEIQYQDMQEVMWVYKTDYLIVDLEKGFITPQEILKEVQEEQPNIEIAGLCKYVRDIPPK